MTAEPTDEQHLADVRADLASARAALSAATAQRERRGPAAWGDPRTWWRSRRHAR